MDVADFILLLAVRRVASVQRVEGIVGGTGSSWFRCDSDCSAMCRNFVGGADDAVCCRVCDDGCRATRLAAAALRTHLSLA